MNKRVLGAASVLAVVCFLFTVNQDTAMQYIRDFLESGYLMIICLIFVVVSIVCHASFVPESNLDVPMFKSNQMWILEVIVNIATYTAITSTAITLLKAIYIQQFYGDIQYFHQFESYDIYTMFAVSGVLLWFSMFKCWQLFYEALKTTESAKVQKA
ncbi:hypothetical protein [Vibrio campbellii]|uniref:hypothetical protein n=1 Tax=Vibrio TaxID=662 RepID=UPI0005EFEE00|nr:hypothetical protein [Vibrio campbellii]